MPQGISPEKRPWYRRRRIQLRILLALLSATGIMACSGRGILLTAAGAWLDVGEPLREPVDGVFILGGDADTRPFAAAALIRSGWARQALIVPTAPQPGELSHQELLREILLRRGVEADAVVELPGQVASTRDEARALRRFLEQHPDHSVAVLTSDYHTRRTRAIFTAQLADCAARVHFVSAPTERFTAANWWHYEQGWKMYVGEYIKLISNLCL
jgi:uncharacterized SAM-binding protein YcdF (DUF218 family)